MRLLSLSLCIAALAVAPAASAKPTPLTGTVGPELTITLTTADGKLVKSLKAGTYAITVVDKSAIHTFHLIGKGVNKVITDIPFRGKKTVVVTLKPGRVIFQCDPHSDSMKGSFTVTP